MDELKQELYLIADEMRGMANIGGHFAANVYEAERAQRIMELAARVAALAEERPLQEVRALFEAEPWLRVSPAVGVDAFVLNPAGEILLVQRKDNSRWAMPGGLAEIGHTPAEAVLRELWEEAGLRGRVMRLLALADGRYWGSRSKVHMVHLAFLVECVDFAPVPGVEMLAAGFFAPDKLPEEMHYGHEQRVPECLRLYQTGETYIDPASSYDAAMPMHQRPAG